jgi:hypothetical protein
VKDGNEDSDKHLENGGKGKKDVDINKLKYTSSSSHTNDTIYVETKRK